MNINYDNKEEREVFREALVKYFPLNSVKVIKQRYGNPSQRVEWDVKDFFDDISNVTEWESDIYLKGKDGWILRVNIDVLWKTVSFKDLQKMNDNYAIETYSILDCTFHFEKYDLIDVIYLFFISGRPECKMAKELLGLYKNTFNRHKDHAHRENLQKMKTIFFHE